MKKFAAFLMILSLSVFSIGCGEGKTPAKSPEAGKTPPADAGKTPPADAGKTTPEEGKTTPPENEE